MPGSIFQDVREWFFSLVPMEHWYLRIPLEIYRAVRRAFSLPDIAERKASHAIRTLELSRATHPEVTYIHRDYPEKIPSRLELVQGGAVKYSVLDQTWPQAGQVCNLLYGISSAHSPFALQIVTKAKSRGIRMVWNQDGVWVPEAYPPEIVERGNRIMAELLHNADHVFFQSQFCKLSSDHFLGTREHGYEVLYNAVDTGHFCPKHSPRTGRELILLISGSHIVPYRLPTALHTLAIVCKKRPFTRLLIAGQVVDMENTTRLIQQLDLADRIDFLPPYNQQEAPDIYRRADILLHTKYNDPCPTVVIEAMACGLPVVYSRTGGVPELVGDEAGYGAESPSDWYVLHPPDPQKLAEGVLQVASHLGSMREAARARAVQHFDYIPWLARHREVFSRLLER